MLMIHADVPCTEVCVCCHKLLFTVRAYIRHTETHKNAITRNARHMAATREDLVKCSNERLGEAMILPKRKRVNKIKTTPTILDDPDNPVGPSVQGNIGPLLNNSIENAQILSTQQPSLPAFYSSVELACPSSSVAAECYDFQDITTFAAPLMREYSFPSFNPTV